MVTPHLPRTMSKRFIYRIGIYLLGIAFIGFGVNLLIRSDFGAGAWDAVNDNFRTLTGITLGTASFSINLIILTLIMLYRKRLKYIITILPIFGSALAMDIWDILLFGSWAPDALTTRFIAFIIGLLVLPFGLSLVIVTKFPAMVFDELTFIMMEIVNAKSFMKVRWGIEVFAMTLASLFGFLAGISFGSVNIGTIIISMTIGPLIAYFLKTMHHT